MDDLWRLRLRRDAYRTPDPGRGRAGCPSFVGKVISTGTNLGVGKFMVVNPVDLTGAETESGAGTATADTSKQVLVYALGPTAPATGDLVVCRQVNHRWVADKQTVGGGGTATVGFEICCPSSPLPSTINLTFTFGSGTNSATYSDAWQSTSLTYYPHGSFPSYHPDPFNSFSARYISPLLTDGLGQSIYYSISCATATGLFAFARGFPGFGTPTTCADMLPQSCSPLLLHGFSTGSNFCSSGFGTHTGDDMTAS